MITSFAELPTKVHETVNKSKKKAEPYLINLCSLNGYQKLFKTITHRNPYMSMID